MKRSVKKVQRFLSSFLCVVMILPLFMLSGCSSAARTEENKDTESSSGGGLVIQIVQEQAEDSEEESSADHTIYEVPIDYTFNDTPLVKDFFDDVIFIGDSLTGTLYYHRTTSDWQLGSSCQIVYKVGYSLRACLDKYVMSLEYRDQVMYPEDIIAASGCNKVYFMLGTNDLYVENVDRAMQHWEDFLPRVREKNPDVKIFIQSIFPMHASSEDHNINNDMIRDYNARLKEFALDNDCIFVDISYIFMAEDGSMADQFSADKFLHLYTECGKKWEDALMDPSNYSSDPRW